MISRALVAVTVSLAVAAAALGAACGSSSNAALDVSRVLVNQGPSDASDASEEPLSQVGDAAIAPSIVGSPLCNASYSGVCYPDNPATAKACGIEPDGGPYDPASPDDDAGLLGCHVVSEGGVPPVQAPACLAAGTGADGSACDASGDCVATQECVGTGMCRRYCCSAPCNPADFCDIQPETQNPALIVPVCVPIRPCGLLDLPTDAAPCPASETCTAFVGSNGTGLTTCVETGAAQPGDSCDSQHCAAGLVCLGMWGEKRCYSLCHAEAGTDCPPAQVCTGGLPLFPNPGVGLCQQPLALDF